MHGVISLVYIYTIQNKAIWIVLKNFAVNNDAGVLK